MKCLCLIKQAPKPYFKKPDYLFINKGVIGIDSKII